MRGTLVAGGLAVVVALAGCGRSRMAESAVVVEAGAPVAYLIPVSSGAGGSEIVSLGAGDALGQRIHLFDVYLAAVAMIGPLPEPLTLAPADSFVLMPHDAPITTEVAVAMAAWD